MRYPLGIATIGSRPGAASLLTPVHLSHWHPAAERRGITITRYALSTTLAASYADAVGRTRAALSEQGFGVLTGIDVAAT